MRARMLEREIGSNRYDIPPTMQIGEFVNAIIYGLKIALMASKNRNDTSLLTERTSIPSVPKKFDKEQLVQLRLRFLERMLERLQNGDSVNTQRVLAIILGSSTLRNIQNGHFFKTAASVDLKNVQGESVITDRIRMTVICESFEDVFKNLSELENLGFSLEQIKIKRKGGGYSDVTVLAQKDGLLIEIQFNTDSMLKAKHKDDSCNYYLDLKKIAAAAEVGVDFLRKVAASNDSKRLLVQILGPNLAEQFIQIMEQQASLYNTATSIIPAHYAMGRDLKINMKEAIEAIDEMLTNQNLAYKQDFIEFLDSALSDNRFRKNGEHVLYCQLLSNINQRLGLPNIELFTQDENGMYKINQNSILAIVLKTYCKQKERAGVQTEIPANANLQQSAV